MSDSYLRETFSELEKKDLIPKPEAAEDRWAYLPRCSEDLTDGGFDSALAGKLCSMKWEQAHPGEDGKASAPLNRLAEAVSCIWDKHVDAPLREVFYAAGDGILRAAVSRDRALGGCKMIVQKRQDTGRMLYYMLHEMAHEHYRQGTPGLPQDWETTKALIRGDPDVVQQYDLKDADPETEARCDAWAKIQHRLWGEPVLAFVDGDPSSMLSMLKALGWDRDAAEVRPAAKAAGTNALKAISSTATELRAGNYIVLYYGRDLEGLASENKNRDGSKGEYFTPNTDLESAYTKTGRLLMDWEHGRDAGPGEDDPLGYVDWSTMKADERGVWVERVLDRRNKYVQWLESLIDAGLIGTSSLAVGEQVQKADDGAIMRWPLKRDTLTVQPMEPRMITENQVRAFKALGVSLPEAEANQSSTSAASAAGKGRMRMQLLKNRLTMGAGPTGADKAAAIRRLRLLVARLDAMENF